MKRIQAEHPFENYWLYVILHRKENRKMANLILKSDTKVRTTISYAKYLMSIKVGRILTREEEVDHIDNDKLNDDIDNLQILTQKENAEKQHELYAKTCHTTLNCSHCTAAFTMRNNDYRYKTKHGQTNFCCSRSCARKLKT